jgi:hypothetical protein
VNTRRTSTLLAAGLLSASLLASPLAFAREGTSEGGGTAVAGQQTKPHTGGKHHRATGQRAKRKSTKLESTGAL